MALKPSPLVPMRQASARSKRSAAVGEPWMPSLCSSRSTRSRFGLPSGSVRGQMKSDSPLVVFFERSKVSASRASTRCTSAPPLVMKIFWPSRKTRPASSIARVVMAPRSDPACGSVRSIAPCTSPEVKRGR